MHEIIYLGVKGYLALKNLTWTLFTYQNISLLHKTKIICNLINEEIVAYFFLPRIIDWPGSASSSQKVSHEWLDSFGEDNLIERITETMLPSPKTIIAANK